MHEFIIVKVWIEYLFTQEEPKYQICELQGNGAYEIADTYAEYGIRNDPCSLEEACSRMSLLVDASIDSIPCVEISCGALQS